MQSDKTRRFLNEAKGEKFFGDNSVLALLSSLYHFRPQLRLEIYLPLAFPKVHFPSSIHLVKCVLYYSTVRDSGATWADCEEKY